MEDRDMWLVQSVEHATVDFGVMSLSPMFGIELTLKKKGDENKVVEDQWMDPCMETTKAGNVIRKVGS